MEFTCEQIGMDQAELQERVVEGLIERILGADIDMNSTVMSEVQERIDNLVRDTVFKISEEHIVPQVGELITGHVFQRTNEWSEKRGEPMSFTEYLVERAENYLMEAVNFKGEPVDDRYGNKNSQTRVTHLIDKHLQYAVENAMKEAVKNVAKAISGGLEETCRIQLKEIAQKVTVAASTGR